MRFAFTSPSIEYLCEKCKQTFWAVNIILCIDFTEGCVEFEVCVMKICQYWDFCISILIERAGRTPLKLFYDQITAKSQYLKRKSLFIVLFLNYLGDDNSGTWKKKLPSKY